ncbi:MAG: DNA polymerase [Youngiibacter sp.]|nr:DNA polymerase [Youngiibacter sp.]
MDNLSIDIETYSSVDLKKSGLYKYVQSPDFEILLFAFSLNGYPVQVMDLAQGESIPPHIIGHLCNADTIKHAYNASFEWYCLSKWLSARRLRTPLSSWRCTMAHGLYCGYTAGLSATGDAIGLPQDKRKLGIGYSLIKEFCVPHKPSKTKPRLRTLPAHEPEKWQLFKDYCKQDVVTEMTILNKLSGFPMPEDEQRMWELDQIINARGVNMDQNVIYGALEIAEKVSIQQMQEAKRISKLDNPKSVAQLKKWLEEETEEELESLNKETVSNLLGSDALADNVQRMLELRQEFSKTSNKKYTAMINAVCEDGRVRGLLQYYGANRTGRWAGRLVQVQNLPRNYLESLDTARDLVKARRLDALKAIYGNVPDTLSQLIRTAFIPSPGNIFLVSDYSAIEARVIAWYAGETWRQEVFRTHGKIYEASASQMFGVPIEKIKKGNPEYALRAKGKVAELALGYQGSSGALINMGALDMGLTEGELPDIVSRWRGANKRIVDLWYAMENAAMEVMEYGHPVALKGLLIQREADLAKGLDFLTIQLPSGRKLFYVNPHLGTNRFGKSSICYWGMDQTSKKWCVQETYGGKLVENIVQATARDCLALAIARIETKGYPIVMHVHDEIIIDAPAGTDLDAVNDIMGEPIGWAPGLLLRGDGFETSYYKKD